MKPILIVNCRFISELTEGYANEFGDILLNDTEIVAIAEKIECEEADILDMNYKTVLPGLIDLHTHLVQWNSSSGYEAVGTTEADATLRYYHHANCFLKQGYTTIRDCGSDFRAANALSKHISDGNLKGPRIISCGLIVTPTETGNQSFAGMYNEADGTKEIKKACREELKFGASFIKIMASGAFSNAGGAPTQPIMEKIEIKAAVEVAKMKDSYVAAHCHSKDAIFSAVSAGVRTIEHASFLDEECIELIKNRKDCYVIPTLSTAISYQKPHLIGSPKYLLKQKSAELLSLGLQAGLKYGWGTDINLEVWLANPAYEFKMRKEAFKCSNIELLKQATIYSAEAAGLDAIIGTIKVGKKADLIVIDGKPDQDIMVMSNAPTHVFRDGHLFHI